jgi:hypothetical protein
VIAGGMTVILARPANLVLRRGGDRLLAGGFPILRRQLSQLLVGRGGQVGQDVLEVFGRARLG